MNREAPPRRSLPVVLGALLLSQKPRSPLPYCPSVQRTAPNGKPPFFGADGSFTEILHTARKVPQFATLRALIFGTNFRQRIAIFLALCEKIAYNGADIN